jgi:amino acid permease
MIPKNTTSNLKKGYSILLLLLPFFAIASGDSFLDNTNDDTPVSPIDNYILLALLLGIYFAYRFFKTQYAIKTKN